MNRADVVVDRRPLYADSRTAGLRISLGRLKKTARIQLLRLETGGSAAFSVYVAYLEGPVVFEASAKLEVAEPSLPPEIILRELLGDREFRLGVLLPMVREVDRHYGRRA